MRIETAGQVNTSSNKTVAILDDVSRAWSTTLAAVPIERFTRHFAAETHDLEYRLGLDDGSNVVLTRIHPSKKAESPYYPPNHFLIVERAMPGSTRMGIEFKVQYPWLPELIDNLEQRHSHWLTVEEPLRKEQRRIMSQARVETIVEEVAEGRLQLQVRDCLVRCSSFGIMRRCAGSFDGGRIEVEFARFPHPAGTFLRSFGSMMLEDGGVASISAVPPLLISTMVVDAVKHLPPKIAKSSRYSLPHLHAQITALANDGVLRHKR